jgi:hypothetical protein
MLLLFLAACLGGCLPELDTVQGERLVYEHSTSAHPCAGTVAYLDRVVAFLEDQIGIVAPEQIRYSWLIDRSAYPPPAFVPNLIDWVIGSHAISNSPAQVHEVVHLVAGQHSAPFFSEGLAVTYDLLQPNGIGPRYWDMIDFDPRRTMAASASRDVEYIEAGFFVTYLLTRHGPEKFRAFYTRIPPPYTMSQIRAAFRSAYGAELDDDVETFMTEPPACEAGNFTVQLDDCSAPLHGWKGDKWSVTGTLDCESIDVVGGVGPSGGWSSFRQFTLDVPTAGEYVLETTGDENVWIRLGPCFGCVWDDRNIWFEQGESRVVELVAGKHYLRISGDSDETPTISVVLRPN